jgi:hypothetical protein
MKETQTSDNKKRILYPGRKNAVSFFAPFVLFILLFLIFSYIDTEQLGGWLFAIVGVLAALVTLSKDAFFLPRLVLDDRGLTVRFLLKSWRYSWKDVAFFESTFQRVVIIKSPEFKEPIKRGWLGPLHPAIPSVYGQKTEELAALLNQWREKYSKWRMMIVEKAEAKSNP